MSFMWWRLAFPLVMIFGPRVFPRFARVVYLVWKLTFDGRVNLLLRLLVPATLIYFVTPVSRVPFIGLAGYLLVLSLAVFILLNLAPRNVIESHAPGQAGGSSSKRSEPDPSKIVEGSYHVVDDDKDHG